ncbi:hypothetical protein EXIGLDRAFT_833721 [Exidia glandulosa HHB12029]|uniref:MYND-type domain-containing protein n=1 Tax=Exidia glandulosa HHB12029 TaxID=1314781 RepID=A0A165KHX8_EXIGL|nr:hypothetical protein EXIGLDRAFT_833721 [Exidia glandulosa HHB12029]
MAPTGRPSADDFAVALGIIPGSGAPSCEQERWMRLKEEVSNLRENLNQEEISLSQFGALYFPALVTLWKSPPAPAERCVYNGLALDLKEEDLEAYGPYDIMLEALQGNPYFYKFMRTKNTDIVELRRSMGRILAHRLAKRVAVWEAALQPGGERADYPFDIYRMDSPFPSVDCATGPTQLLCTLLCYESRQSLEALAAEPEIRDVLLPVLRKWTRRYARRCLLGDTAMRCEMILSLNPLWLHMATEMRRQNKVGEGLECALPACTRTADLKKCGKCETAKYCSAEHQRAHYPKHKALCFRTVF